MVMLVCDPEEERSLIRDRRRKGHDRFDEVWDGISTMSPLADNNHQEIATFLAATFLQVVQCRPGVRSFAGLNVSDRQSEWRKNYRCSDVDVFLPDNPANDDGSYWRGGPDFCVELISSGDRSREKMDFYARVGVRELLIVDRKPWSLELYRLADGSLKSVGKVSPDLGQTMTSLILPVSFRLLPGDPRPLLEVTHSDDSRRWAI